MRFTTVYNDTFLEHFKRVINMDPSVYNIVHFHNGTDDPSIIGLDAPKNSVYLRTVGTSIAAYIKQDDGFSTNWLPIADNTTPAPSSAMLRVLNIEITEEHITNQSFSLPDSPASEVAIDFFGGIAQEPGRDFTVSNTTVSWSGLQMQDLVAPGDRLRVMYMTLITEP